MEILMLDEKEYLIAHELYGHAIREIKFHKEREQSLKAFAVILEGP